MNITYPLIVATSIITSHLALALLVLLQQLILLLSEGLTVSLLLEIVVTITNYNSSFVFDLSQSKWYLGIPTWRLRR
jgi:hypothetical protein